MAQKILFLKGLPASGKSTFAKELVNKDKTFKRINRDDLRAMLDNGNWSRQNEKTIKHIRNSIIMIALVDGFNVVVDDTNILGDNIGDIKRLVEDAGFDVEYEEKFFNTPLAECIRRDMLRPESVGKKVIRRMYDAIVDEYVPKIEYNPDLPDCIIVDIDGTLAHMNGRTPYDYTKVNTDLVDEVVSDIVRRYRNTDIMDDNPLYVVIVSGRDDTCRPETEEWLKANNIPYDELHMRDHTLVDEKGQKLDDTIIKKDLYDKWVKPRYNVKFVLDDRNRVVDMWRSIGLKVLQVGEGDF
jgi:predicted kinase